MDTERSWRTPEESDRRNKVDDLAGQRYFGKDAIHRIESGWYRV